MARDTVVHNPSKLTYRDLKWQKNMYIFMIQSLMIWDFNLFISPSSYLHFSMSYSFTGDIALHLGLVDSIH